jgi:catechol 2,3-dioxygenase-like lactoylglutathione lyase family enzyme
VRGAIVAIPVALVSVIGAAGNQPPLLAGLDHIPIAVRDLEQASRRYQALGFSLKPGRVRANGIRNQHVKFPDGTELELITAQHPKKGEARLILQEVWLSPFFRGWVGARL